MEQHPFISLLIPNVTNGFIFGHGVFIYYFLKHILGEYKTFWWPTADFGCVSFAEKMMKLLVFSEGATYTLLYRLEKAEVLLIK